jgi:hypothetical protein
MRPRSWATFWARHADGMAFALLGLGTSWTLADTIVTNFPVFMKCLPAGLYLPDKVGLAATLAQTGTLVSWWLYTRCCKVPSYRGYVALIWTVLGVEIGGAVLVGARTPCSCPRAHACREASVSHPMRMVPRG